MVKLFSAVIISFFFIFHLNRKRNGAWYLLPRTDAPNKISRRFTVYLSVYEASGETNVIQEPPLLLPVADDGKDPCFCYRGSLNRDDDTETEILDSGKYLGFHDNAVKPLKRGRNLFEYSVSIVLCCQ